MIINIPEKKLGQQTKTKKQNKKKCHSINIIHINFDDDDNNDYFISYMTL